MFKKKLKAKQQDNSSKNKIDEFNYLPYIYVAGIIVVFTIFAPFLFAKLAWGIEFNDETAYVGDTIGGLTAPFLSVAASVLVFAALRAQIQANRIVLKQFEKEDLQKEDDIKIKMELLVLDIEAILKDIENKGESLKTYGEHELSAPFEFKVLPRTASKSYSRINSLEREFIYEGFKKYFSKDIEWVKKYHKLYNHLDFIDAFFPNVYTIYDSHVREQMQLKKDVLTSIDKVMTESVQGLKDLVNNQTTFEISNNPFYQFINNVLVQWYSQLELLEKDKKTLDVELLNKKITFFDPLISEGIKLIKSKGDDPILMRLIEGIRLINMSISLIEFKGHEIGNNMLDAWKTILEDKDEDECAHTGLNGLKVYIENGMNEGLKEE